MTAELGSFLRGTLAVDLLLAIALYLTLSRQVGGEDRLRRLRLAALFAVAVVVQAAHFAEEWAGGLCERLPLLLGLEPWPLGLWAGFNVAWLGVWMLAPFALRRGWRAALLPAWFLALACVLNGVVHPLLALAAGGYFPGLWTSPVAGITGVVLLGRLTRFTRPDDLAPLPAW